MAVDNTSGLMEAIRQGQASPGLKTQPQQYLNPATFPGKRLALHPGTSQSPVLPETPPQGNVTVSPRHAITLNITPLNPTGTDTQPTSLGQVPQLQTPSLEVQAAEGLVFNPASPGSAAQLLNTAATPQPLFNITTNSNSSSRAVVTPAPYAPTPTITSGAAAAVASAAPATAAAVAAPGNSNLPFATGLIPQGWTVNGLVTSGMIGSSALQPGFGTANPAPPPTNNQASCTPAWQPLVQPGSAESEATPGSAAAAAATFQATCSATPPPAPHQLFGSPSAAPQTVGAAAAATSALPEVVFGARNGSSGSGGLLGVGSLGINGVFRLSWDSIDMATSASGALEPAPSAAAAVNGANDGNADLATFLDGLLPEGSIVPMQGDLVGYGSLTPHFLLLHSDSLRRLSSQQSQNGIPAGIAAGPGLNVESGQQSVYPRHAGMGMMAPSQFRNVQYGFTVGPTGAVVSPVSASAAAPARVNLRRGSDLKSVLNSTRSGRVQKHSGKHHLSLVTGAGSPMLINPDSPRLDGLEPVASDGLAMQVIDDGLSGMETEPQASGRSKRHAALNSRRMIRQYATDSYTADELQQYTSGTRRDKTAHKVQANANEDNSEGDGEQSDGGDDSDYQAGDDASDESEGQAPKRRRAPHTGSAVGLSEHDVEVGGAAAAAVAAGRRGTAVGHSSTSAFKGVTRHRWTGKWEAHLWDAHAARKTAGSGGRTRGRQVYLGGYATEEEAARAYDRAAIAYWGDSATTNYSMSEYAAEMDTLMTMPRDEVVQALRRGSSGFARGASRFRGVTRHHQGGKWEARLGKANGCKYQYLGCFDTEEEAARAYDVAALQAKGNKAMTNFPASCYDLANLGQSQLQLGQAQQQQFDNQEIMMLQDVAGELQ